MKIIDLTHEYVDGFVAGRRQFHPMNRFTRMGKIEKDGFNTASIVLGSHQGTHVDAPSHLIEGGATIDALNLETCVGDVTVVDFSKFGRGDCVELENVKVIEVTERMLFAFKWYVRFSDPDDYLDRWPYFSTEAIKYLMNQGMKMIAVDVIAPDYKPAPDTEYYPNHVLLMKKGITIIENVANTDAIDFKKKYVIAALPLRVKGLDGAPCRVVLMEK